MPQAHALEVALLAAWSPADDLPISTRPGAGPSSVRFRALGQEVLGARRSGRRPMDRSSIELGPGFRRPPPKRRRGRARRIAPCAGARPAARARSSRTPAPGRPVADRAAQPGRAPPPATRAAGCVHVAAGVAQDPPGVRGQPLRHRACARARPAWLPSFVPRTHYRSSRACSTRPRAAFAPQPVYRGSPARRKRACSADDEAVESESGDVELPQRSRRQPAQASSRSTQQISIHASAAGLCALRRGLAGAASPDAPPRSARLVADVEERARHLAFAPRRSRRGGGRRASSRPPRCSRPRCARGGGKPRGPCLATHPYRRAPEIARAAPRAGDYWLRSGDAHNRPCALRNGGADGLPRPAASEPMPFSISLRSRTISTTPSPSALERSRTQTTPVRPAGYTSSLAPACLRAASVEMHSTTRRRSLALAERTGDASLLTGAPACAAEFEYICGRSRAALPLLERALDLERWPFASLRWNSRPPLARGSRTKAGRRRRDVSCLRCCKRQATAATSGCASGSCRISAGSNRTRKARCRRATHPRGRRARATRRVLGIDAAGLQGELDAHLGRVAEARSAAAESLELALATKSENARLDCRAVLGFIELSVGDLEAAARVLVPLPSEALEHGYRCPLPSRSVGERD